MHQILTFLVVGLVVFSAPSANDRGRALAQDLDLATALDERSIGDAAAPITILAFESFNCSHCAAFHADVFGQLQSRYIDPGHVRLVYRDFPLNLAARLASQIARCADPQLFFGLASIIFNRQNSWSQAANPVFELGRIGRLAGMSQARMEICVDSVELAEGIEAAKAQALTEYAIAGTPTFVINGEVMASAPTIDAFAARLDPLIEAAN